MLLLLLAFFPDEAPSYAVPDLLVEADALLKAKAGTYTILDARPKKAFDAGHYQGAQPADGAAWGAALDEDAPAWTKRLVALGIEDDKPVVVYGPAKTPDAARVWWMLKQKGVKDARLVNGGWEALVRAGAKPSKDWKKPKPGKLTLEKDAGRLATKDEILKGLKDSEFGLIIDARSKDEHCGDAGAAKRKGHIPGSKHLEWSATLNEDGTIKTPARLAALFKEAGIDPKKPATTYCQGGGRAAVMAFVVELMGGKPARNYYKSWGEWGNDPKTPVEK